MSLEIDEDLALQRVQWRVERIGWVLLAAAVVAALLGLFGPGPISLTAQSSADVEVRYNRFARLGSPLTLDITLRPEPGATEVEVALSRDYLEQVQVEGVTPEPDSVRSQALDLVYVFGVGPGAEEVDLTFDFTVATIGPAVGSIGPPDGERVTVSHLFYP